MDNRSVTDGMMILKDGLSSGIVQQYERHRYLDSNTTNTDANYSEGNSQFGSFSNRSSRSSSSAMRGRFSQTLLQASLLSYKDANAPRSQYSQSHRSSSTRGDSKSSSKYDHLNELAASAKNNS